MSRAGKQQGVAAIELSLVLGVLLMLFTALLSFSILFLVQQKITHMVGDVARESVVWPHSTNGPERIQRNNALLQDYAQRVRQEDAWFRWLASELNTSYEEGLSGNIKIARFTVRVALENWFWINFLGTLTSKPLGQLQAEASILLKEDSP